MTFVFAVMLCGAQTATLKWGKPFSRNLLKGSFRLLSLDENGMAVLSMAPSMTPFVTDLAVVKFDANLNYTTTTKIPLKDGDKALQYEFIVRMKEQVLVFSSYQDRKAGKTTLYYQPFDMDSKTLSGKAVSLLEMPIDKKPIPAVGSFDYVLSRDSSKLALIYNPPSVGSDMEKFGCAVMDKDLKVLYSRVQQFPFTDRNFTYSAAAVSGSGVLYMCGPVTTGHKKPFSRESNYVYTIFRIDPGSETASEVKADYKGVFVTDMQLACDASDNLVAGGFYSEKGTYSIKGCYFIALDGNDGTELRSSIKEFPISLITAGMTDKQAERTQDKAAKGKNIEMEKYYLDDLVLRTDGGFYLVAEQNYSVTTYTTNSNGSTSEHTTYYGKSIIVVGVNGEGTIDVTQKILKAQKSSDPAPIGYVMSRRGDHLFFVFTDNALNNAPNPPKTNWASYGKSGVVTIVDMDPQGNIKRKNMYTMEKNNFYPIPYMSRELPDGRMIMVTLGGMKFKMLLADPE